MSEETRPGGPEYLGIGDLIVTDRETRVLTILGSCVSFVLYDRASGLCGICHAQLPDERPLGRDCRSGCPSPCGRAFDPANSYRYLVCATKRLAADFEARGVPPARAETSLFGGSRMLEDLVFRVGDENIRMARELARQYGFRLVREDVGGQRSRRLVLDTATGACEVTYSEPTRGKPTAAALR